MRNRLLFQIWRWSRKNWTISESRSAPIKVAGFGCPRLYLIPRTSGVSSKATSATRICVRYSSGRHGCKEGMCMRTQAYAGRQVISDLSARSQPLQVLNSCYPHDLMYYLCEALYSHRDKIMLCKLALLPQHISVVPWSPTGPLLAIAIFKVFDSVISPHYPTIMFYYYYHHGTLIFPVPHSLCPKSSGLSS